MTYQHQQFLPESMYPIDSTMDYPKLQEIFESNKSVTGLITRLNSKDQLFEVFLGNGLTAFMHFDKSTIYPIYKSENDLSPNIYELVGKKIRAKIIVLDYDLILLSRKENMLEALDFLKGETFIQKAQITAFSTFSAFFDIGAGIIGRSNARTFANIRFHNVRDVGFKEGDILSVNILNYVEEMQKFDLSRVATLPSHMELYNSGDSVVCKIYEPMKDSEGIGYFALVDKSFCAVVDSPEFPLNYGDEIVAYVKKVKPEGLKLYAEEKLSLENF